MSDWQVPEGYVLTRHEGYAVNHQGFKVDANTPDHRRTPHNPATSALQEVFWFDEDEPFVWTEHDGRHPRGTGGMILASPEAKAAAKSGAPMAGWSPNGEYRQIQGGYVPPEYQLHLASEAPEPEETA